MAGKNEASLLIRIKQSGGEVLDRFVITMGDVMDAVKKAAEFLSSFVEAYREQEEATNRLSQAMVNQGMYTTELRKKYEEQAEALQKVTQFSDDQIISAQAQLQANIGQKEISEKLTRATLDLAAAKGIDLASAAEIMGKAISNNTSMLTRYGIQAENSSDKSERMANVIDAVNKKFGGQAEVAAEGLGSVKQLANAYNDFQEIVGQRLAPVIILIVQSLKNMVEMMKENGGAMDAFIAGVQAVAQTSVVAFGIVEGVFKGVANQLASLASVAANVIAGDFTAAWEAAKNSVTVAGETIADSYENTTNRLNSINQAFLSSKDENLKKEEELEQASRDRRAEGDLAFDTARATKKLEEDMHKQDAIIQEQQMAEQVGAQRIATQVKILDKQIADAESYEKKKALVKDRGVLIEAQKDALAKEQARQREAMFQGQRVEMIGASSELIGAVAGTESKAVFLIQKAAALAQTMIATQVASAQALASIPYPANLAAAANIETIGYIKMGTIAATAIKGLATGGIVPATNGGTPFILGEGGKDEAVIPLDDPDAKSRLGGGGMTVIFQGPFLGNEEQADQFARVMDRALLRLRQSNQSLAFETDVF